MTHFEVIFLVYLGVISLASIFLTALDKSKAKNHRYRIPEATLFLFAALGGSIAMYITMFVVHHKTKKLHFLLGIPLIFLLQCVCVYAVYAK